MFLHETPENWSIHVDFFAHTSNTQPLSHLHISPYETVFRTQPRIPLNFQLNLSRNPFH